MNPELVIGLASGIIGLPILAIVVGVVLIVCGFNDILGTSREPMKDVILPVCRISLIIIGIVALFSVPDSFQYWVGCLGGAGILQLVLELSHQAAVRKTSAVGQSPILKI